MGELDSRDTDRLRWCHAMIEYCFNWLLFMSETRACAKCGSRNTTVTRVKGAWGPFARLVEYPGMGKEIACGDCGHTEIDTSDAPTRDQLARRTWFLSIAVLIPFLIYLWLNNL